MSRKRSPCKTLDTTVESRRVGVGKAFSIQFLIFVVRAFKL